MVVEVDRVEVVDEACEGGARHGDGVELQQLLAEQVALRVALQVTQALAEPAQAPIES